MEHGAPVWLDGKLVKAADAKASILTHSMQYGSGIFEGIRAYKTQKGAAIFRLPEHAKRLVNTARICGMPLNYDQKEIEKAVIETVRKSGFHDCYIRPFAFYNDQRIGLDTTDKKVSLAIFAVQFGNYFQGKDTGIRCIVSSWSRFNSQMLPPQAKLSGNYANSILASAEAKRRGADEAILLSSNGYLAEGPGENIFLVEDSVLVTPSKESDILIGITRDSLIKIAEANGLEVEERFVHREELYTCDELFFTGTAAELTPITEVDSRSIGKGKPGPITKMLSGKLSEIVQGKKAEYAGWLTFV
jgi:branched-chain amino acid aminotransferase